jgi:hypothetical protein
MLTDLCSENRSRPYAGTGAVAFSRIGAAEGASMSEFADSGATALSFPFTLSEPLAPTTYPEWLPEPADNALLCSGECILAWPLFMVGAGVLLTLAWTMLLAWEAVPIVGMLGRVVFELMG